MFLIKLVWKVIWNIKTIIVTTILLASLAVNIVLFVGGSLYSAANNAFEALTGIQTLASRNKAEIAQLSEEVIVERNAKREIRGQLTETTADLADTRIVKDKLEREGKQLTADLILERRLKRELTTQLAATSGELATVKLARKTLDEKTASQAAELALERNAKAALRLELNEKTSQLTEERLLNRSLKGQLRDLGMGLVPFKGEKVTIKAAIDETAAAIGNRAQKSAAREIASMPGEAPPYLGTAVIVGVTTLELSDLCATLKDMSALKGALNPSFEQSEEELEVCSIKVPAREDIVAAIKASPEKVWIAAKDAVPSMEELKEMEIPDLDWSDIWLKTKDGGSNVLNNASEGIDKAKRWWVGD